MGLQFLWKMTWWEILIWRITSPCQQRRSHDIRGVRVAAGGTGEAPARGQRPGDDVADQESSAPRTKTLRQDRKRRESLRPGILARVVHLRGEQGCAFGLDRFAQGRVEKVWSWRRCFRTWWASVNIILVKKKLKLNKNTLLAKLNFHLNKFFFSRK